MDEEILAYIDRSLDKFKDTGYYNKRSPQPYSERYGSYNDLMHNDNMLSDQRLRQNSNYDNNYNYNNNMGLPNERVTFYIFFYY